LHMFLGLLWWMGFLQTQLRWSCWTEP
jgi:hypothetical protein